MDRFVGRTAFVTGGAHGIGRAAAFRLSREGAFVTIADIDREMALHVASEMDARGQKAIAVHCDITDPDSVEAAIAESRERFGSLDVLVHTAGGDREEPSFDRTGDNFWHEVVDFNLMGTVRCIRAAIPHLLRSEKGGNVVAISSINALTALGSYPYSSAKAGMSILVQNLAAEYGRLGLRFNLIAPATIRTRVWDDQPEALAQLTKLYPLGRVGEPEDIASAIAFLASDDAAWITGITLPVDGGMLSGPRAWLPHGE